MHRLLIIFFTFLLSIAGNSQAANSSGIQNVFGVLMNSTNGSGSSNPASTATIPAQTTTQPITTVAPVITNSGSSNVFGAQLFTGSFLEQGSTQFNPDYMIEIGDQIQLQLWGGFTFNSVLTVDPQGNLFLPQVGPQKLLGVRNQDLQKVIESAVRRTFRANVYSYASLAAAQPVRIFVGGFVNRPGLYNGTSMDSLLFYLDQAGGIDTDRGSFIDVQIKRGEQIRAHINLYDFLLKGQLEPVQLMDGDVIFIPARQNSITVSGLAANTKSFEFKSSSLSINELSTLARPKPEATHVRVTRNKGVTQNTDYYALAESSNIQIESGDAVEFTADKRPGTITVRVEGQHQSAQEYVLPYGSHFGELIQQIKFSERSDIESIQLFRRSVRDRQKEMLLAMLKNLQSSVLTVRSGSTAEAALRKEEAAMILQWVERAKTIEPNGQVLIAQTSNRDELLLENGDVIKIPTHDGLVLVSGEVVFPNAVAYNENFELADYISKAGGYTQNANSMKIVIAHQDGSFNSSSDAVLRAGDEILVLPEVQVKSRQIATELTQAIYQIALSARLVMKK